MFSSIESIFEHITQNQTALGITLYPCADSEDIKIFETDNGIILPDDFKSLYKLCNGFESEEDMFRIIPLNEISNEIMLSKNTIRKRLPFAEYMIYSDTWEFSIDKHSENKYLICNVSDKTIELTDSLIEFLSVFLKGGVFETGGLYDWHNKLTQNNNATDTSL